MYASLDELLNDRTPIWEELTPYEGLNYGSAPDRGATANSNDATHQETTVKYADLARLSTPKLKARFIEVLGHPPASSSAGKRPWMIQKILSAAANGAGVEAAPAKAPAKAPEAKAPKAKAKAPEAKAPEAKAPEAKAPAPETTGAVAPVATVAQAAKTRGRDPRIPPPGTILRHVNRDKSVVECEVGPDDDRGRPTFIWKGKVYTSLSTIARDASDAIWNGLLFFGLVSRPAREKKA